MISLLPALCVRYYSRHRHTSLGKSRQTCRWITGGGSIDNALISIYVDGEATPSLQFTPALACGVGPFNDAKGPWATSLFGKLANSGGWFNDFRIPFQRSVNVTIKAGPGGPASDTLYMIVTGSEALPVVLGGVTLPTTARLRLAVVNSTVQPLEFVDVLNVPTGAGAVLGHTLTFTSPNLNTLEVGELQAAVDDIAGGSCTVLTLVDPQCSRTRVQGCHHLYVPPNAPWPGVPLSTGTEDFFQSA